MRTGGYIDVAEDRKTDSTTKSPLRIGLNAVYQNEYKKSVLQVLDRKSDLVASITQQLLTAGVSSSLSASGYGAAALTAVKVGSAGISAAKGVAEIKEIKQDLLHNVSDASNRIANSLPGFDGILSKESRLSVAQVAEISQKLQAAEVIPKALASRISKGSVLLLNEAKIGLIGGESSQAAVGAAFQGGIGHIAAPVGGSLNVPARVPAPQAFVFEELGGSGGGNNGSGSGNSSGDNGNQGARIELGYLGKNAEEVRQLLQRIAATKGADYSRQIDSIADEIAEEVGSRMRGLIKTKIVSPITGALVDVSTRELVSGVVNYFADPAQIKLQKHLEASKLEQLKSLSNEFDQFACKACITGVAAGDECSAEEGQTYLAEIADKVIYLSAKYEEFAAEYPWLAEHGLEALSYGLKGFAIIASGGTLGAAIVVNEARSLAMNAVAGDAIATGVNAGIKAAAEGFLQLDSSLSDEQAQSLASAVVLGALLYVL